MSKIVQCWLVVCALSVTSLYAQVPDRLADIKKDVWNGQHFNGEAERGAFVEAVICYLRPSPEWKHLKKFGGQNNHNGHAVDAILHVPTGYAVDIATDLQPIWIRDAEPLYADPKFIMEPINCGSPTPAPSPAPVPDPPLPPVVDLSEIHKRLDFLAEKMDMTLLAAQSYSDSQLKEMVVAMMLQINALRQAIPTSCKASVFGINVKCQMVK